MRSSRSIAGLIFIASVIASVIALRAQEPAAIPADQTHPASEQHAQSPADKNQASASKEKPSAATSIPATKAVAASAGPSDPKAKQTFADAAALFKKHDYAFALDGFRKADKQDGVHCIPCETQAYLAARSAQDFKAAREETGLLLEHMANPKDKAQVHYMTGSVCLSEGLRSNHEKDFEAADGEFQAAIQLQPAMSDCLYGDGLALTHLKQDGTARERFQQFLNVAPKSDVDYARAERFAEHPELARERVAPNFQLTALDGQTVTLESLTGKVVLIDFWATWCGPCREALPRVKEIARKFQGQPFVVVSISMDKDGSKWKEFIAHNDMTWMQYRDGYFEGPIAKMFAVNAIPATFTIDADGVLQDQHVGDANIEGKIKKLIARAQEGQSRKTVAEAR
jgi:thiol-disulfide isomerase/thioredoxin